jgi:hypothetical protein
MSSSYEPKNKREHEKPHLKTSKPQKQSKDKSKPLPPLNLWNEYK